MDRSGASRPLVRLGCVLVLAGVLVVGCAGGEVPQTVADAPGSSAPATSMTSSAAPTSSSSTSSTSSTAPLASSPSSSSSADSGASSSAAPSPLQSERKITLASFFAPSSAWEEERFSVADQEDVTGIAARVQTCGDRSYQQDLALELRLENKFSELRFSVGQSNASTSSDQNLSVEVIANNSQVEIRSIPFNELQDFAIPVESVNALKIQFTLDDKVPDCGGEVTGVIVGAVLS